MRVFNEGGQHDGFNGSVSRPERGVENHVVKRTGNTGAPGIMTFRVVCSSLILIPGTANSKRVVTSAAVAPGVDTNTLIFDSTIVSGADTGGVG